MIKADSAQPDGGDYEIVDAYARNPLNQLDATQNFLGNIYFDGTGFRVMARRPTATSFWVAWVQT